MWKTNSPVQKWRCQKVSSYACKGKLKRRDDLQRAVNVYIVDPWDLSLFNPKRMPAISENTWLPWAWGKMFGEENSLWSWVMKSRFHESSKATFNSSLPIVCLPIIGLTGTNPWKSRRYEANEPSMHSGRFVLLDVMLQGAPAFEKYPVLCISRGEGL